MPVLLERPKADEVKAWQGFEPSDVEEAHGIIVRNNPLSYHDPSGLRAEPFATIQCDGNGSYEVVLNWAQNIPQGPRNCVILHEQQHIKDWERKYGKDSCKNKAKGYLPTGGPGYSKFLAESECDAYAIGKQCAEEGLSTGLKSDRGWYKSFENQAEKALKDCKKGCK